MNKEIKKVKKILLNHCKYNFKYKKIISYKYDKSKLNLN